MTDLANVEILELANNSQKNTHFQQELDYDFIKNSITHYIGNPDIQKFEILEINDLSRKKYLKDCLVVVSTQIENETHIFVLQYPEKAVLVQEKTSLFQSFIKLFNDLFSPQETDFRKEGRQNEIKEWMR